MFGDVDSALGSFMTEMKEQGRWGDVVVISVSDFARTLTSNGRGTDHGWGGIHWVAGGSVNGKQVLGKYPTTLTDESELSLGQGRLIPTTPFESVWNGIAEWFGVPGSRIRSEVLPNVDNFPASQIFTRAQMFRKAP
jgi:cullin-associated NEDD8-dissociated protein 1